jgi:hypothetical protein
VTWVNAANQEGVPSLPLPVVVSDGNLMTVQVTSTPKNVMGFNIYAGTFLNAMMLQNNVALPIGATFEYVPAEVTQGRLPGNGQQPDFTRPLARTMLRG